MFSSFLLACCVVQRWLFFFFVRRRFFSLYSSVNQLLVRPPLHPFVRHLGDVGPSGIFGLRQVCICLSGVADSQLLCANDLALLFIFHIP